MKSHTGYEIKKYFFGKPTPQEVQVSFSMDYHGWLKLEKSNEWLNFLEALASFQTK